jgi:hypothetical protein
MLGVWLFHHPFEDLQRPHLEGQDIALEYGLALNVDVKLGLRGISSKHHVVGMEGLVSVIVLLEVVSEVSEFALLTLLDDLPQWHELVKHYVLSVAELFDPNGGVFPDNVTAYIGDSLGHDLPDDTHFGVEGFTEQDGKVNVGVSHPVLVVLGRTTQVLVQE